jgi:hypothetical protein
MDFDMDYAPHIQCLMRDPWIVGMHVVSDAMIWGAYFAIPAALWYCARFRRDLLFRGIIVWFGIFIIGCGLTHAGNILEIWEPAYWFTASVKLATGIVSWITLAKLLPIIPQVLNLPSLDELENLRQWMIRPQADRVAEMLEELDKITKVAAAFGPKSPRQN